MHAQRLFASLLVCLGLLSSGTAMSETIQVSIDGKSYPVEMADNADARAFIARLPMTLTFENFGRNERIAYPKPALELERSARHFEITRGTMTVYKPWGNMRYSLWNFRGVPTWPTSVKSARKVSKPFVQAATTPLPSSSDFLHRLKSGALRLLL